MTGDSLTALRTLRLGSWQDVLLPLALSLLAAYVVFNDLVLSGPMAWHVVQPAVWQGGLEALLLALIAVLAAWQGGRTGRWLLLLAAAVYLRRHHVDLPLIATLLTAETLVSLGLWLTRQPTQDADAWQRSKALLAGALLWWLLMLALHALWLGHSDWLLWLFALVALGSLLLRRRSVLLLPAWREFELQTPLQRAVLALIGVYLLIQFARSNSVIGYDTLWYLARGQFVLAPNGSLFEPLGLVSAVHYAPKLWETWLLPWEAAQDLSFQFGQTQIFVGAGLLLMVRLCARLGMPRLWQPLVALTFLSLPAIAATALQLKNDIVAWYLVLMMLCAACEWLDRGQLGDACWVLVAALLAVSAKLTVLPMVAAIAVVMLGIAAARGPGSWRNANVANSDRLVLLVSVLITLALLYRTWRLCGLPTIGPEPLVQIWRWLGFELQPPAGSLQWLWPQDWASAWRLLPEALFLPNALPKVRIAWTGHVWLLCGLLGLWWRVRNFDARPASNPSLRWLLWPLALLGLVLLLAWRYETRGADGNYYLVPVTAACVLGFSAASASITTRLQALGLASVLGICTMLQTGLSFVSAGWSAPGTRTFDLAFSESPIDTERTLRAARAPADLEPVYRLLATMPDATRTLMVGPSQLAHLLPTRVEALENLAFSRPEYIADGPQFRAYLQLSCLDLMVIDKLDRPELYQAVQLALEGVPNRTQLSTGRWEVRSVGTCNRRPH